MKASSIIFILFVTAFNSFAGNKIQWQKFLNDTTVKPLSTNWLVQAKTIDALGNLYFAYIGNGGDTTTSILVKYSKDGEFLWKNEILPSPNKRYRTCYERRGKMYFDLDGFLVFIAAGYDTLGSSVTNTYKRFIWLNKLTANGELVESEMDYVNYPTSGNHELGEIEVTQNGDIFISHDFDYGHSFRIVVNKYNKNFDSINTYHQLINYDSTQIGGHPIMVGWVAIAADDSFLHVAFSENNGDINIKQFNINSSSSNWTKKIVVSPFHTAPIQLEIMNNELFLCAQQLFKISLQNGMLLDSSTSNLFPISCVFDKNQSKIYCRNNSTNINQIDVYDTNFQVLSSAILGSNIYNIEKKDSTIYMFGMNTYDPLQRGYINMAIYKSNSNFILQDSIIMRLPLPVFEIFITYNQPDLIISDTSNLFILYQTFSEGFYDSLFRLNSTNPILIQKICFNCTEDIKGKVYIDVNQNCQYDSIDYNVSNNLIHLMPEDIYTSTDSNGFYSFIKSQGIGTVEYIQTFPSSFNCNNINSYTVNVANGYADSLDFGLIFQNGFFKDISTKLISNVARPGFVQYASLDISNLSNQKLFNSKVVLIIDSNFSFISSNLAPDSILGNQVFWTIDTLNVLEVQNISIQLQVIASGSLIGTNFVHSSNAFCLNDIDTTNNIDTTVGIIVGSFDPNYIAVEPIGISNQRYIENGTTLDYYIEFQNTGTDTAFNIKILDKLDEKFDLATLRITGSSHPMDYSVKNNILKFSFPNILLVDSNKDYDKSIGYVTYSIKPKLCKDGTIITNKAEIYFDFNEPIITNTVFNTIGKPGSYFNPDDIDNMNIFPNPGNSNLLNVVINLISPDYELMITDFLGRRINFVDSKKLSNGKYYHSIKFTEAISQGVYFIIMKTPKGKVVNKWSYLELIN